MLDRDDIARLREELGREMQVRQYGGPSTVDILAAAIFAKAYDDDDDGVPAAAAYDRARDWLECRDLAAAILEQAEKLK